MSHLRGDFEACSSYRSPLEHDDPVCATCGHLADDHAPGATVLEFRDRRSPQTTVPARRAS